MPNMRRIEANRRNAQRSTGPKTAEGKACVAQNAVAHGLLSQQTPLPDEDLQALEGLAEAPRAELIPHGPQEQLLVELMDWDAWKPASSPGSTTASWSSASHEARRYECRAVPALTDHDDQAAITDPQKHQQARAAAERPRDLRNGATATAFRKETFGWVTRAISIPLSDRSTAETS